MIVAGACVNACLNLVLIPHFQAAGAAAASILAETLITGLYFRLCRGYIRPAMLVRYGWKRLAAAVVMLGAVLALGNWMGVGPLTTFAQIGAGGLVYFAVLLLLRDGTVLGQLRMAVIKFMGYGG